jgi:hypothetical protein
MGDGDRRHCTYADVRIKRMMISNPLDSGSNASRRRKRAAYSDGNTFNLLYKWALRDS